MDVHEVLVKGRNLIDREGWEQGAQSINRGKGPYCAMGAVWHASKESHSYEAAAAVLARLGFVDESSAWPNPIRVGRWNDYYTRTKDEVLAAFDEAIAQTAPPPPDLDLTVPVEVVA